MYVCLYVVRYGCMGVIITRLESGEMSKDALGPRSIR